MKKFLILILAVTLGISATDAQQLSKREIKAQKKDSEMTEDEAKASDKAVQDLTDKFVKEIDVITANKTKEIMEI